jgi:antirestriction protein ArdC
MTAPTQASTSGHPETAPTSSAPGPSGAAVGARSAQHPTRKGPSNGPEALQKLEQALEHACTLGGWRDYLSVQARFHRYSFRNTLMILQQRPTASRVAGFHDWLKLSRHVKKGEKGIGILAPLKFSKLDESTGETVTGVKGFKLVYVFDLEQTDGEPLPERPIEPLLDGPSDHAQHLTNVLSTALEREGLPVKYMDLEPGHYGSFNRVHHVITLSTALGDVQRLSTLVHETAHARLHAHREPVALEDREQARALREFEAESVACVVLEHLGLNMTEWSANYLASYGMNPEHLVKIGSRVQLCAAGIIEILLAPNQHLAGLGRLEHPTQATTDQNTDQLQRAA